VVGLAAAALAASVAASAAPATPAFDAVATGAFPALPDRAAAPASIPAGEKVDGLVVEQPPSSPREHRRHAYLRVEGSQCLYGVAEWVTALDEAPTSKAATVSAYAGVTPFRQERLVQAEDGSGALEVDDLWVDPATLGARVFATKRIPLTRLAAGPGEFAVYGLRAGDSLHVVVPTEQVTFYRESDGRFRSVECGHVRARVEIEAEGGAMASISAFPKLPPPAIPRADRDPSRPLAVQVSLSKVSRDPAPLLGVTVAWAPSPGGVRGD
jgi:hypothetical protein